MHYVITRYNTASGMNCCNDEDTDYEHEVLQLLQYRKRYELLQLFVDIITDKVIWVVTIPQAV